MNTERWVNWNDLRYILAVSREGTLLGAARSLRVSPTTMTRRIRALEEAQGSALFEKKKHGAVLNAAGMRVVQVAQQIERQILELDAEIGGMDQRLAGVVRVTSIDFVTRTWLRDFGEFRRLHPGVSLELTSTMNVLNLTRREADVAIRVGAQAPPHLLGARHAELFYAIYAARALVEEIGCDAGYGAYPWLSWDLAFARSTDEVIERLAPNAEITLRVTQMNVMVEAVTQGLGITILPCVIGDAHPGLRRVGDYFEGGLHLWVLTHPELRNSARVMAFTRFVRTLIARDLDLFEGRRLQPE